MKLSSLICFFKSRGMEASPSHTQPKQEGIKANAQYHQSLNKPIHQSHLKLKYPKNCPLHTWSYAP